MRDSSTRHEFEIREYSVRWYPCDIRRTIYSTLDLLLVCWFFFEFAPMHIEWFPDWIYMIQLPWFMFRVYYYTTSLRIIDSFQKVATKAEDKE